MRFCRATSATVLLALAFLGCSRTPMPEASSAGAQLYAQRCAQCHALYIPASLTAEMWKIQVDAMQDKMRQAEIAPLNDGERETILDYLTRNAGKN